MKKDYSVGPQNALKHVFARCVGNKRILIGDKSVRQAAPLFVKTGAILTCPCPLFPDAVSGTRRVRLYPLSNSLGRMPNFSKKLLEKLPMLLYPTVEATSPTLNPPASSNSLAFTRRCSATSWKGESPYL